jgi:YVTN family beta-propeller protein
MDEVVTTPIRVATNSALKPVKVGRLPGAIAVTPDGKTIYVVNLNSRTVTPTRVATNTALRPIKVGGLPEPIVITPDGKTIYVVNLNSRTVTPTRVATNTALPPIKARLRPAVGGSARCRARRGRPPGRGRCLSRRLAAARTGSPADR